jgi:aspartyl-tRNA(Asn)/glutamyl-tRNA(Gln) amidotransferase subunit B
MSDARTAAQWVASRFPPLLKKRNQTPADTPVTPKRFGELLKMVELDEINVNVARDVLAILFKSDKMPAIIINERGFRQISDASRLEAILDDVIAAHPAAVEDYRKGKKQAVSFLIGQAIRVSWGKANPSLLGKLLKTKLG